MPVSLPGARASSRLLGSREISPEHTRECAQWHGTSGGIDRGRLRCLGVGVGVWVAGREGGGGRGEDGGSRPDSCR